jgi:hypothetical protein
MTLPTGWQMYGMLAAKHSNSLEVIGDLPTYTAKD